MHFTIFLSSKLFIFSSPPPLHSMYKQRMGTVHGEDLPYIFGAPLVEGFSHFPRNYTKSEVALSEAVMIFWSNFARTGNPNEHHRQDQVLLASKERNRFRSINWEEYDPVHQKYLEIGMYITLSPFGWVILVIYAMRIRIRIRNGSARMLRAAAHMLTMV